MTTGSDPSQTPVAAGTFFLAANSHRQAMDWSLVLVSQGLEGVLLADGDGHHGVMVPLEQAEAARAAIETYRHENRRWRWQRRIPSTPFEFHWGSIGWVMLLSATAAMSARIPGFYENGRMEGASFSAGELWRMATATMLHADGAHLLSNLIAGWLFLGIAMGLWGGGVALFSVLVAGMAGNVASWSVYSPSYTGVGASGMVMGAIGLLAASPMPSARLRHFSASLLLRTVTPAVLLFVLYGFPPKPNTDWVAHIGGFLAGGVLGWLWRPLRKATGTPRALNHALLIAAVILGGLAWAWAMSQGRP